MPTLPFTLPDNSVPPSGPSTVYQAWQPQQAPTWLQRPYGAAWSRAHGQVLDVLVDRAKAAVKARFASLAPSDALAALGLERQIDRGPSETDANFAARVQGAWDTWPFAGTAYGMLKALAAVGYTSVVIVQVNQRGFTLDGSGNLVVTNLPTGSWKIDATQTFWSKFQVLFPGPLPASWVSGGVPADGSAESQRIKLIVNKWKPAHATCAGYVIVTAGGTWGWPTGTWGPETWGGDTQITWTS